MTSPSQLEQKYLLLNAYFPGIQLRKMSQSRYLEKKEEVKRAVRHARQGSLPDLRTLNLSAAKAKKGAEDASRAPAKSRSRIRSKGHSMDLTTIFSSEASRQPQAQSSLWVKRIGTVKKDLQALNGASRCAFKANLPIAFRPPQSFNFGVTRL